MFTEDMILKAPSPDVMNKLARSVLALYSYDGRPDDMSLPNQLRQAVELIARVPVIVAHAFAPSGTTTTTSPSTSTGPRRG